MRREELRKLLDYLAPLVKDREEIEKEADEERALRRLREALARALGGKEIIVVNGTHLAVLLDDYGYCELEFPEFGVRYLERLLHTFRRWRAPLSLEASPASLEELARRGYLEVLEELRELLDEGLLELVNGTYSLPFLTLIGYESNIMQFVVGLRALERLLGRRPKVYLSTEFALHPQLPQILAQLGYQLAVIRARLNGEPPKVDAEAVLWVAPDGSGLLAIPQYETLPVGEVCDGRFYEELAAMLKAAAGSAISPVILENFEDVIYPVRDLELFIKAWRAGALPIEMGAFGKAAERLAPEGRVFSPPWEEYRMRRLGTPPELLAETKLAEHALLAAEAAEALATLLGLHCAEEELGKLWRALLRAQHHDAYVCPMIRPGDYMREREAVYGEYRGPRGGLRAYEKSLQLLAHVKAGSVGIIRRALRRIAQRCLGSSGDDIIVFNPLAWNAELLFRLALTEVDARSIEGPEGRRPIRILWQDGIPIVEFRYPVSAFSAYVLRLSAVTPPRLVKGAEGEVHAEELWVRTAGRRLEVGAQDETFLLELKPEREGSWRIEAGNACAELAGKGCRAVLWGPEGLIEAELTLPEDSALEMRPEGRAEVFVDYPFGIERIRRGAGLTYFVTVRGEHGVLQLICPSASGVELREGRVRILLGAGQHKVWVRPASAASHEWLRAAFSVIAPRELATARVIGGGDKEAVQALSFRGEACVLTIRPRGRGAILRAFNPSPQPARLIVESPLGRCEICELTMDGSKELRKVHRELRLKPWRIVTLGVEVRR